MKTFEEYCEDLTKASETYNFGAKDPDKFFDAIECIADVCKNIKDIYPDRREDIEKMLDAPSEPVRRIAAFCLLEHFALSNDIEHKAMKVITDFLVRSYGPMHIVWLTWLENYERRNEKKSGYALRAELSPLKENYAMRWLKIARENQTSIGFISDTPEYPFDSLNFVSESDNEEEADEFPY